jgi:hypothetical protein
MKILKEIKSMRSVSGAQLGHEHNMSATSNGFFGKRKRLNKARNILHNNWLLSFQPGPNSSSAWTLTVLPGLGRALGPVLAVAKEPSLAHEDL